MTTPVRRLAEAVHYAARQKILLPIRRLAWRARGKPFVFRGEKGLRFHLVPPQMIDGEIYVHGIYERQLLHLLHDTVSGRVMLDVGANIGNHALFLADRFQRVICFEPNPGVVERLKRNVALNHSHNIVIHDVGLSDENAELPFHNQTTGNLGGGSFVHTQFPVSEVLPVRIGDELLADLKGVDFIKLDVEGLEIEALRGLRRTIERDRPIIAFEYDGARWEPTRWEEFKAVLPDYRFTEMRSLEGPGLAKFAAALKSGVGPRLVTLDQPEPRFYEAVFAFPHSPLVD